MVTFNRPESQPEDAPAASETEDEEHGRSLLWLSGSGLSVALSVAFYLLVLGADVKFDTGRHTGSSSSGAIETPTEGTVGDAVLPVLAANSDAPPADGPATQALTTQDQASASDKSAELPYSGSRFNHSERLAQYERHEHRHALRTRIVTYNPVARPGSPEYVANLYRH
jgi:hypothetical protein